MCSLNIDQFLFRSSRSKIEIEISARSKYLVTLFRTGLDDEMEVILEAVPVLGDGGEDVVLSVVVPRQRNPGLHRAENRLGVLVIPGKKYSKVD